MDNNCKFITDGNEEKTRLSFGFTAFGRATYFLALLFKNKECQIPSSGGLSICQFYVD